MTIKSLELRDAMDLTEIYVRRGNTVTVRLTGRPGDPVKWRARCNCFFSDEHENPVHAYLDWEARAGEAERRIATALGNAFR